MYQAPRAALDQGERRRYQRVVGGSEADLLRESQAQYHSGFAVVGQTLTRRAVDQDVQIGQPPQRFACDSETERMIGRRKIANCRASGVDRLAAPKYGVENLESSFAGSESLSAWHRASRTSC
jgi:hypothetical protein